MLRIIGGEHRSRILQTPRDDTTTRPWTARARESVFNLLRGWCDGARVLDLFAGVGSMGLEAISRGAAQVVMVERTREIVRLLESNIASLGCGDRARAVQGDALGPLALTAAPRPVDLLFMDPPYAMMEDPRRRRRVLEQLARCRAVMGESGFAVLRSPVELDDADGMLNGFDGPETHRYGQGMYVLLYAPCPVPESHAAADAAAAEEGSPSGPADDPAGDGSAG